MHTRRKVIKAIVALVFLLMPQLILFLHERGSSITVTVLCILHVLFYGYAVIIMIGVLIIYRPTGMAALYSIRNKRGSFLVLMIGSYHIAYALFVAGWGIVSTVLMATYATMQIAMVVGTWRLKTLSNEEKKELLKRVYDCYRKFGPSSSSSPLRSSS